MNGKMVAGDRQCCSPCLGEWRCGCAQRADEESGARMETTSDTMLNILYYFFKINAEGE